MKRTRSETRNLNWTKAIKKRRICREIYGSDFYDNLHQYHNNKIHCSCPKCRADNPNLGKNSLANQSITNQKKISEMKEKMNDFYED